MVFLEGGCHEVESRLRCQVPVGYPCKMPGR